MSEFLLGEKKEKDAPGGIAVELVEVRIAIFDRAGGRGGFGKLA